MSTLIHLKKHIENSIALHMSQYIIKDDQTQSCEPENFMCIREKAKHILRIRIRIRSNKAAMLTHPIISTPQVPRLTFFDHEDCFICMKPYIHEPLGVIDAGQNPRQSPLQPSLTSDCLENISSRSEVKGQQPDSSAISDRFETRYFGYVHGLTF